MSLFDSNFMAIVHQARRLDAHVRRKYNITDDSGYTCPILLELHRELEKLRVLQEEIGPSMTRGYGGAPGDCDDLGHAAG